MGSDTVGLVDFALAELSLDQTLLEISTFHFSTLVGALGLSSIQTVLQKAASIFVSAEFQALLRGGRAPVTYSTESYRW